MKISKTIETASGGVTFEGELNGLELDFIVEAGISFLVQQGMIPFKMASKEADLASFIQPSRNEEGKETLQ